MLSKRSTTVVCTTAVAALLATVVPTTATAAPETEVKTLVIGIDGATFDFLDEADMPNLDALRERGLTAVSNLYANPMAGTISGPGWTTIATGTWPDKHNVVNNSFTAPNLDEYPDYLSRIEAAHPERSTAVVATWGPIVDNIYGSAIDSRIKGGNDAGTAVAAAAAVAGPLRTPGRGRRRGSQRGDQRRGVPPGAGEGRLRDRADPGCRRGASRR